jgi:hypothetical protein
MNIQRLHEGFGVENDSCIQGRHPMTAEDLRANTQGVYLGPNPQDPYHTLYLTYWEAEEVAQKIGLPQVTVYQEQKRLLDEQAQTIADLKEQLEFEINSLQVEAVAKEIRKSHKELLGEIQSYNGAVRARIGNSGSAAGVAQGATKPVGAAKAK